MCVLKDSSPKLIRFSFSSFCRISPYVSSAPATSNGDTECRANWHNIWPLRVASHRYKHFYRGQRKHSVYRNSWTPITRARSPTQSNTVQCRVYLDKHHKSRGAAYFSCTRYYVQQKRSVPSSPVVRDGGPPARDR